MAANQFLAYVQKYAFAPVQWVRDSFGAEPDGWQCDVLNAYAAGERRISVRSAHGVGKTAVVAWMSIHHMVFRFPQKTAITAPSRPQAFDALYAEIRHWIKMLPDALQQLFDVKADRIELKAAPQSSFLSVRTSRSDQPEALQGVHSDHVLLVGDEASGIPEAVFEAAAGSMSSENALTVLIGNPVRTSGLFFDTHHKLKDMWFTVHVSAFDSARVVDDFILDIARRYGEDSNAYRIRVLGEFPKSDDDSIIPYYLIEEAVNREVIAHPETTEVWGLDVARFGSDRSALCKRKGSIVTEPIQVWHGLDLMQLTGAIKHVWDETETWLRPKQIYVDAIGVGAGVADRLRELGLPVVAVNVSEAPAMGAQFRNQRTELWFEAKKWLESKAASLPANDSVFTTELSLLKYSYTSAGKLQAESKSEVKKRLGKEGRSTDLADAFVLTFAGGGGILLYGSLANSSWNEPIKRNIKGVV